MTNISITGAVDGLNLSPECKFWLSKRSVQPSAFYAAMVDRYIIKPAVANGSWQLLDAFWLLGDDPSLGNSVIANKDYQLSLVPSPVHTNTVVKMTPNLGTWDPSNSAPGPKTRMIPGIGVAGDGTYTNLTTLNGNGLNTYYPGTYPSGITANNKFQLNSGTLFMWQMTDISSSGFAVSASGSGSRIALRGRSGTASSVYLDSLNPYRLTGVLTGLGFTAGTRYDSGDVYYGKGVNGAWNYFSDASVGPVNSFLSIGWLPNGVSYDPNVVGVLGIGGAFTEDQLTEMYHNILKFLIAIGAISGDNPPSAEQFTYGCFSANAINNVSPPGLKVYMNAAPPLTDSITSSTYAYFPVSVAFTQQVDRIVACTNSTVYAEHFIWGDRAILPTSGGTFPNQKPNPVFPTITSPTTKQECRISYTTQAKADAAWLIKMLYSAGCNPRGDSRIPGNLGWLDVADAAGFDTSGWSGYTTDVYTNTNIAIDTGDIMHHAQFAADPDSYFIGTSDYYPQYAVATDMVYLPIARIADATMKVNGFTIDCEQQNGRTPSQLITFLTTATQYCHAMGYKLTVYNPNPIEIPNGGGYWSGFQSNSTQTTAQLYNIADYTCITAWNGNPFDNIQTSINAQIEKFGGNVPWSKIMLVIALGLDQDQMSHTDALWLKNFISTNGITAVNFWRNYGVQGGPLSRGVNQTIATILGLPTS